MGRTARWCSRRHNRWAVCSATVSPSASGEKWGWSMKSASSRTTTSAAAPSRSANISRRACSSATAWGCSSREARSRYDMNSRNTGPWKRTTLPRTSTPAFVTGSRNKKRSSRLLLTHFDGNRLDVQHLDLVALLELGNEVLSLGALHRKRARRAVRPAERHGVVDHVGFLDDHGGTRGGADACTGLCAFLCRGGDVELVHLLGERSALRL